MDDPFTVRENELGIFSLLKLYAHSSSSTPSDLLRRNITTEAQHADDFGDMGHSILITATIMTVAAFLMVLARLYVRLKMTRSWGLDDYFILVSLALSIAGYGFIVAEVLLSTDSHVNGLTKSQIERGLMLNFATQPIFAWGITFVKISVAFFLLRIAPSRSYVYFLWGAIVFLVVYTSIVFLATLLQCRPLYAAWSADIKGSNCFSSAALRGLDYSSSCLCLITDILFAFLPIPMLWYVQIKRRVKFLIYAIMSLGIFAAAANAVRIFYMGRCRNSEDYLFASTDLTIWTTVECNIGIIAASVSCIKPLLRNFVTTRSGSLNTNTNDPSSQLPVFGDFYFASDSRYIFPMNPLANFPSREARKSLSRDIERGDSTVSPALKTSIWESQLRADLQPVRQRGAYDAGELLYPRGHVNGGGMVMIRPIPEDDASWLYAAVTRDLARPHALSPTRPLQVQRNPLAMESRRESLKGTEAARSSNEHREHERKQATKLYAKASGYALNKGEALEAVSGWPRDKYGRSRRSIPEDEKQDFCLHETGYHYRE